MDTFKQFELVTPLQNAINKLGFSSPTPIQVKAFNVIRSGKNMVGISQTGTGKTLAYLLPILQDLRFSKQNTPRWLILVPTRELVVQIVEEVEKLTQYLTLRVTAIYGGTNINTQRNKILEGVDMLVATPGRLYDLTIDGTLKLNTIKQLIIDEVDVMLDLGFQFQLNNLFELMPSRRQNIMFSATMTEEINTLIKDNFIQPEFISIAVSGTPVKNIKQTAYCVKNFYTKANLLAHLLTDSAIYKKVLIFISGKKNADRLFAKIEETFGEEVGIIHANKTQNFRLKAIEKFDEGSCRLLISTDLMARGLDLNKISHVISFDTPLYPENYIHRIGRTGRASHQGNSILLYTKQEEDSKLAIELLMDREIEELEFPKEVTISEQLTPAERPSNYLYKNSNRNQKESTVGAAFHEKKLKNQKTNQGSKYKRELAKKYKKPKTKSGKKKR